MILRKVLQRNKKIYVNFWGKKLLKCLFKSQKKIGGCKGRRSHCYYLVCYYFATLLEISCLNQCHSSLIHKEFHSLNFSVDKESSIWIPTFFTEISFRIRWFFLISLTLSFMSPHKLLTYKYLSSYYLHWIINLNQII